MNISSAVEDIITVSIGYMGDMNKLRTEIANILQELLNTEGVAKKYLEEGK